MALRGTRAGDYERREVGRGYAGFVCMSSKQGEWGGVAGDSEIYMTERFSSTAHSHSACVENG
jgi:hypothetical protein